MASEEKMNKKSDAAAEQIIIINKYEVLLNSYTLSNHYLCTTSRTRKL